jgi:hypothetical protein
MSFAEIGTGFVNQYYQFFATVATRPQLRGIYRPNSLMTWVGEQLQGVDGIMNRFATLQFNQLQVKPELIDCHPSLSGGVLAVVNGELLLEGEAHPLKFNDVFHLAQDQTGQWYVSNQMFRIIGGGGH